MSRTPPCLLGRIGGFGALFEACRRARQAGSGRPEATALDADLEGNILALHARKTQVVPRAKGVPFLGFVLYPDGRRRIRRDGVKRFRRRLRTLARDPAAGRTTQERVSESVRAWFAHADHAQADRLRARLLKEVTFRCRPNGRRSS